MPEAEAGAGGRRQEQEQEQGQELVDFHLFRRETTDHPPLTPDH